MLETVIRGTHSISEYKQAKATLEELTQQAYKKHSALSTNWIHGEPVKARYNEVTGQLQITYSDSLTFEYNRNLDPVEVIK